MTESQAPRIHRPPIVVLGVQQNDPPYRLVEIAGELAGKAHSVLDVIEIAREVGLDDVDLDDPDVVRWVGGDKFTWTSFWPPHRSHHEHRAKRARGAGSGDVD
ncbi:hypothetical protein ADL28_02470 [Streptomyces violaceusniger]|uniref:Uncharacterized protein n=3 Tax=Streptomyces TaxID=1883 RepID=A0ABD5J2R2_9ACTN|nr:MULTISPECIES: hypothetical protein [Streptomyces]KUL66982.1 hypothetical protein ADL28_02470 [Streptomyces violaceusniger]MEE4582526.1 hypothetical protein [Streptomyces sp. DSM 41602]RSS43975.1 hypothetical protein EF902_17200 [Streptomyces sp. WAC05858]